MSNIEAEKVEKACMGLGGLLFAVEGVLKLCGITTLLGATLPCGLAMLLLGAGCLLHARRA